MNSLRMIFALGLAAALAAGCRGTAGGNNASAGIALPEEISALPPKAANSSPSAGNLARERSARALAEVPADSDYAAAKAVKWVNEQALSQFDILNSIFKAVSQTNYADSDNVNQGPYGAMVAAPGGGRDGQSKALEPWTVESILTQENGQDVNVVHIWFTDAMSDPVKNIRAVLKVFAAPSQLADGSYADYGVWTLTAQFDGAGSSYFLASAERGADGASVVKVHEVDGPGQEVLGVLHKSGASGYGKVSFPDWSQCHSQDCQPSPVTVAYVYDADHVELESAGVTLLKDRNAVIDLVERYGVFDAVTGEDVSRSHRFGFPIQYTGPDGVSRYGYYGAWQGQHQIWANGQALPAGLTVTRADRRPGQAAETYTTSSAYPGVLVKRKLVPGDIQDIAGVVVGTWDSSFATLIGDGAQWQRCDGPIDWMPNPSGPPTPSCPSTTTAVNGCADYQSDPPSGRQVNLNAWDVDHPVQLTCDPTLPTFFEDGVGATYAPDQGRTINVNAGGPIWIAYDGAGWVKKGVLSMDPDTHQPTFDPNADAPYDFPSDHELYLNDMGLNYVVKRTDTGYSAQIELQTRSNPVNVTDLVPAGAVLSQPWGQDRSTFDFVTAPASDNFMKLVYRHVGASDPNASGAHDGDVVTSGQWGLVATVGDVPLMADGQVLQFNWEYPQGDNNYAYQQFLVKDGALVLLDDPIRFAPMDLVNGAGAHRTYSLQFDGNWMSGLPDVHRDLEASQFVVTADIQVKAVAIPDGADLEDAADSTRHYLVKRLEVAEYLALVENPGGLDPAAASALDLSAVPSFAPTGLSATAPAATLKYSEGVPVE